MPAGVELVAAAKTRTAEEILEAIEGGIKIVGENYVQEAEKLYSLLSTRYSLLNKIEWHFIGHLQKNKVKKAIRIFDMIESVDCLAIGEEIDKASGQENKTTPILIEINSGREKQKFGVLPEDAEPLIKKLSRLSNIKVMGLMTMGPRFGNPEDARPYFRETKRIFERIKAVNFPNVDPVRKLHSPGLKTSLLATERVSKFSNGVEMKFLSMGMSNSYQIAIAEGANIVRIGTGIFGERQQYAVCNRQ